MALSPFWYEQLYTPQRPRLISRKAGVSLTTQGLQSAHTKIGSFQKSYCYPCLRSCRCFLMCGFSWETWSFKTCAGNTRQLTIFTAYLISFLLHRCSKGKLHNLNTLLGFCTHCPTSSTSYSFIIHDHLASISWTAPEFEHAKDTSIGLQ